MKNRGSFSKKISAHAVSTLMSVKSVMSEMGVMGVVGMISLMILVSCSSDKGEAGLPVVRLCDGLDNVVPVKLSEVAEDIRYIPLETWEEALVGGPQLGGNLRVKDGVGFFVGAWRSDVGVHHFGPDGKFIRSIGKKGRAKGEFVFNTNIVLAHDRNEIAIGSPQKTVVYTLENEFLREIMYDTLANRAPFIASLGYMGNGRYTNMCTFPMEEAGNPNVYMAVWGDTGKLDKLYPVMEEEVTIMGVGDGANIQKKRFVALGLIYKLGDDPVYARTSEDTLYKFDENFSLVPYLWLDKGKYKERDWEHRIALEQGSESIKQIGDKILLCMRGNKDEVVGISSTLNEMFTSFLLVYDMKTGTTRGVKFNPDMGILGLENDLDGGAPFFPDVVNGDKMYQILDAITFMDIAQKSSSAKMKEIAATLTEESNPVIVEVTIR